MIEQTTTAGTAGTSGTRHRTDAETGLIDCHSAAASALPGSGWVARIRHEAIAAFAASGLPSRRQEAFKYTDLKERIRHAYPVATGPRDTVSAAALQTALGPLAALDAYLLVFVDGVFDAGLSRTAGLEAVAEFMPLAPLLAKAPAWLEGKFAAERIVGGEDAVTRLNTAYMRDGLLIKLQPGQRAAKPVLLVSARAAAAPSSLATRNIVAMEAGSAATLIEAHVALPGAAADGLTSVLTDVTVADTASFDHLKVMRETSHAAHLGHWSVDVGSDAAYRAFQLTPGTRLVRSQIAVRLAGPGSRLDISGTFLGRGSDHIDTTLTVRHAAPGCESRELFKGVLDDRARGVFQGKIIVDPGAVKTDGKQMARALMLSEDAEFDSKPELEIYADDVACGHGATTAELDPDLMFYCRSRGIPEPEARSLLVEAFVGEAIDKVEAEDVRSALLAEALAWLAKGAPQPGAKS